MDTDGSILDWNRLLSLREVQPEDGPDIIEQIATMFREDSVDRLARARAALQRGDAKALRLEANSLRGTAGLIGAGRLFAAATVVEREAAAGALATIGPLVDAMAIAISEVAAILSSQPQKAMPALR